MTLNDVRVWINSLPVEYLEWDIHNAINNGIDPSDGIDIYRDDKIIRALDIDDDREIILFLND